jgi:hypothetical protein
MMSLASASGAGLAPPALVDEVMTTATSHGAGRVAGEEGMMWTGADILRASTAPGDD